MSRSKQKNPWRLLSQQLRFAHRRLAASFVEMVGALPCRPEPRSVWDNAASPGRALVKGYDAALAGWIANTAAIATESRETIEETAKRVEHFFNELKSVAMAPYYARALGEASDREKRHRASKEMTEALHAIYTDEDIHRQIREIDEAVAAMLDVRATLVVSVNAPANRRTAMGIVS